jgi:hypothetical protein
MSDLCHCLAKGAPRALVNVLLPKGCRGERDYLVFVVLGGNPIYSQRDPPKGRHPEGLLFPQ